MLIKKNNYDKFFCAQFIPALKGGAFLRKNGKGANDKKTKMPIMFKVKTLAWLDKLKDFCNGDDVLFSKLS